MPYAATAATSRTAPAAPPQEVGEAANSRGKVAHKLDRGLRVDGDDARGHADPGDEQQVKHDIDGELGGADDERDVGLVEGARGRRRGGLYGRAQRRERAQADVLHATTRVS